MAFFLRCADVRAPRPVARRQTKRHGVQEQAEHAVGISTLGTPIGNHTGDDILLTAQARNDAVVMIFWCWIAPPIHSRYGRGPPASMSHARMA